jgi:hypothetical protein
MTFALFALLPLGLASWFSRRELAYARSTAGLWPLVIGMAASAASKWLGGKAQTKKEEAANTAAVGAAEIGNQQREDTRTAHVDAASSLLGSAGGNELGHSFALDPSLVSKLGIRRSYDFKKGVPKAGAGAGYSFLSGLAGTVGDVAGQYAANQQNDATMQKLLGLTKTGGSGGGSGGGGGSFDPGFGKTDFGGSSPCPPGQIC